MDASDVQFFAPGQPLCVLTTQPLDRLLDYRAPEGGAATGAFVEVPLGPRKVLGVVWGAAQGDYPVARLRQVLRVLDVPPMRDELRAFLLRAADYTLTPLSLMLFLATRAPGLFHGPAMIRVYRVGTPPQRMTDARKRVYEVFDGFGGAALTVGEITRAASVSGSVVHTMAAQGALIEGEAPRDQPYPRLDPARGGKDLSEDQSQAADELRARAGDFSVTLLKGVTGSGKTEVYLEAVAECLRKGRQALVLLPEIGLTEGFLERVEARFGARPGEWHSGATVTERRRLWRMVGEGRAQLVVGARSALFLPYRDLGLIVVDEEHDSSYKQEDGVLYNARDMAVLRADTEWLQRIRPLQGHNTHFHVRLRCPAGSPECQTQTPTVAELSNGGNGCDASLEWWVTDYLDPPRQTTPAPPASDPVPRRRHPRDYTLADLPGDCSRIAHSP